MKISQLIQDNKTLKDICQDQDQCIKIGNHEIEQLNGELEAKNNDIQNLNSQIREQNSNLNPSNSDISKSKLFTSTKDKNKLREDFLFIKELWEGKENKKGFNTCKFSPILLIVARFNLIYFIKLVTMAFIVQGFKMSLLYYKRKIIKLFFNREQKKIENYTPNLFRLLLYKNISFFLIIEATRFVLNHQLKQLTHHLL